MGFFDQSTKAFQKASDLAPKDAQIQYNLGLSYFKEEEYTEAIEHLKQCTSLDPKHPFAYNNLAFIYNMHCYYHETIQVCNFANVHHEDGNHNCFRHWAFALFKKNEMAKAINKIT